MPRSKKESRPEKKLKTDFISEEIIFLCELDNKRLRMDFRIKNSIYGELVCSYYPSEFDIHFAKITSSLNFRLPSDYYANQLLEEKIRQNMHDAMVGMFDEIIVQTICALNKREYEIQDWSNTNELKKVAERQKQIIAKRIGAKQGRREDFESFFKVAFDAFNACFPAISESDVSEEFILTTEEPNLYIREKQIAKFVTQEILAEQMEIGVRTLAKQEKRYGFTHKQFSAKLAARWCNQRSVWLIEYICQKLFKPVLKK